KVSRRRSKWQRLLSQEHQRCVFVHEQGATYHLQTPLGAFLRRYRSMSPHRSVWERGGGLHPQGGCNLSRGLFSIHQEKHTVGFKGGKPTARPMPPFVLVLVPIGVAHRRAVTHDGATSRVSKRKRHGTAGGFSQWRRAALFEAIKRAQNAALFA